jgi:hypothetical protein
MSNFALVAQAANLLGQVLKHVSSQTTDQTLHDEESMQLDQTLHAFVSTFKAMSPQHFGQIVICYKYIFIDSLITVE